MANSKKKTKAQQSTNGSTKSPPKTGSIVTSTIPMASYISVVGVHTTLWAFAGLYLPRTAFLTELIKPEWDPTQLTSQDRPQHPFLEALTLNPTYTLACICLGAAILQTWWAGWLRKWWLDLGLRGTDSERSAERAQYDRHQLTVSVFQLHKYKTPR